MCPSIVSLIYPESKYIPQRSSVIFLSFPLVQRRSGIPLHTLRTHAVRAACDSTVDWTEMKDAILIFMVNHALIVSLFMTMPLGSPVLLPKDSWIPSGKVIDFALIRGFTLSKWKFWIELSFPHSHNTESLVCRISGCHYNPNFYIPLHSHHPTLVRLRRGSRQFDCYSLHTHVCVFQACTSQSIVSLEGPAFDCIHCH